MPFVLDASIAARWAFPDETDYRAELAFDLVLIDEAIVPALWWFEIRNTLIINERRKRISEHQTAIFLRELSLHPIRVDQATEEGEVLRFARQHRLSVYDAAYLELAHRERLPLATLDSELSSAARAEKVKLLA